jgi:hypothetical protein
MLVSRADVAGERANRAVHNIIALSTDWRGAGPRARLGAISHDG